MVGLLHSEVCTVELLQSLTRLVQLSSSVLELDHLMTHTGLHMVELSHLPLGMGRQQHSVPVLVLRLVLGHMELRLWHLE